MRKSLVKLFALKFNIPLYWEMIPESVKELPVGCYIISSDSIEKELDGVGVSVRSTDFAIDIMFTDYNALDLVRNQMLILSGKTNHRYCDLFQMIAVRSAEDTGAVLGVTTTANEEPHMLSMRITMFE